MLYYEFKASLARGEIAPVYMLSGDDKYWVEQAYADLLSLSSELDTEVLSDDRSVDDAIFGVGNFPMMSEKKIVVVRDRKLKDADIKLIETYLKDPAPTGILILYNCEGSVKGAKEFDFGFLQEGEIVPYVVRLATEMGGSIEEGAARKLVRFVEFSMTRVKNELIKLVPIGEITEALVEKYVEPSYSYRVFDFTDAIARGSYSGAYEVLSALAGNAYEYSPFFTRLIDYVRLMLHVKLAKNEPDAELAKKMGVSPYPLQKAKKAAAAYTSRQLLTILMKLYELEEGFKTGEIGVTNAMDLAIAEAIEARKR